MLMGNVTITATGGAVNVSAPPMVGIPSWSQQQSWDDAMTNARSAFPAGPLDVFTVACWQVDKIVSGSGSVPLGFTSPPWKCGGPYPSGPAVDLPTTLAQTASGTINSSNLQACSWLSTTCTGVDSPQIPGNIVPNLDAFVGQTLTFNIETNWCSYIAPPGYDVLHNLGPSLPLLGCANETYGVSFGTAARQLSAAGNPLKAQVRVKVQASSYDCRVPKVKGLTLTKARHRLRAAHCAVGLVSRVKGKVSGRVRYQPLKVGTGRPRGFPVTLAVVR